MEDFEFIKKDTDGSHEDYWFEVLGESKEQLTKKYYNYGMVEVTRCVYSKDKDIVGVRRQYPFNYDTTIPNDKELKNILVALIDLFDI